MWIAGSKVRQEAILENKNYRGTLQKEAALFKFKKYDISFELGFKGDPFKNGRYSLKVEGCPIEYLQEVPKRERPNFEIARSEVKTNMNGANPLMKFPLIVHGKFMNLLVTHNKNTKFTKVQLGKHCSTIKGKKLNQDGVWPIVLICTDLQFKIHVVYEVKSNLFVVNVQDEPYLQLPYVSPNHNYGDADEEMFKAKIMVNGEDVLDDETTHWNYFSISEQVEETLLQNKMSSFAVKNL